MNLFVILSTSLVLQAASPMFPDTPSGRVAQELVDAVQSGDNGKIGSFVESHLQPDGMLWTSRANFRVLLKKVHDPKGLELGEVQPQADGSVTFTLTSRQDGRRCRAFVFSDPSGKQVDLMLQPAPSEEEQKRFQWPESNKPGRQATLDTIRRQLDLMAKNDKWSGVVLIAKGDKVLLTTTHGLAERALQVPIRAETRFDIASAGKMFTAVTLAQLVDEGKVSLDDKVGKYLPDYPDAAVREKVTLRHLLTHTAGVGTVFGSPGYDRTRRYANATELSTALHGEPLGFEPGTSWSYSNGGFVLLGAIIERVEGRDYRDCFRQRIWEPLGMRETGISGRDVIVPNLARIYDLSPLDPFGREPKVLDNLNYGWIGGPHGGGHSSAMDLFRFARALKKGQLMKPQTLETFLTPPPQAPNGRYALGFETATEEGQRLIGHGGHQRAYVGLFWDADITVIALGNDLNDSVVGVSRNLRKLIARNVQSF